MSAYREFTGKSVEEALRLAREAFSAGLDDLDFEILTSGSRGVLGMGAEPARILAAPRSELGGAAPKREAASARPLPVPPPRDRDDREDRSGHSGDRDRGPRRDDRGGPPGDRDRAPRRDDRPRDDRPRETAPAPAPIAPAAEAPAAEARPAIDRPPRDDRGPRRDDRGPRRD